MQGVNIAKKAQNRLKSVKIGHKMLKWTKSSLERVLKFGLRANSLRLTCQASDHQVNHSSIYHCLTGLGEHFVVLAQTAVLAQPAKCALHNPASGQDLAAFGIGITLNNLENPATGTFGPINQLASVAAACPDQTQATEELFGLFQNPLDSISILDVSCMDGSHRAGPECQQGYAVYDL